MTPSMHPLDGAVRAIAPELLLQQLRSRRTITILDVRARPEYRGAAGRIVGARSVPLDDLPSRYEELLGHRYDRIVVVSDRGIRAQVAGLELRLAGFTEVSTLDGGMERWNALHFPVEIGSGVHCFLE